MWPVTEKKKERVTETHIYLFIYLFDIHFFFSTSPTTSGNEDATATATTTTTANGSKSRITPRSGSATDHGGASPTVTVGEGTPEKEAGRNSTPGLYGVSLLCQIKVSLHRFYLTLKSMLK